MIRTLLRITTTTILVLLVALSLVLSYLLWSGSLKQGSEIGFVQSSSLPTASTPDMSHALRPYRVLISEGGSKQSVVHPASSSYSFWTSELMQARAYDETEMSTIPLKTSMAVTFQFGVEITKQDASKWLSTNNAMLNGWQGRTIVLYTQPKDVMCRIAFVGDNRTYSMRTDLNATDLLQHVQSDIELNPYETWGYPGDLSYVPDHLKMTAGTYTIRQADTLPLVHSFFVNPNATTKIQQDSSTTLWTDGSRAVQWNQKTGQIRYEDPNGAQPSLHNDAFLTALDFIHTHGGGAANMIGFDQISQLTEDASSPTIMFTQYMNNFPILDAAANYDVDLESGRVLEYTRPLWVLQKPVKTEQEVILNKGQLIAALKKIDPKEQPDNVHVQLGYILQSLSLKQNQVHLVPAYEITSASGSTWVMSAVDGSLISGSDNS